MAEVARIGARQSMEGRDWWRDTVFVDRLWGSVKYEEVYLRTYNVSAAPLDLGRCFEFSNGRPQESHGGRIPDMVNFAALARCAAA